MMQLTRLLRAADRFLSSPLVGGPGLRTLVIWRDPKNLDVEVDPKTVDFDKVVYGDILPYYKAGTECPISFRMLNDHHSHAYLLDNAKCYISPGFDASKTLVYSQEVFDDMLKRNESRDPITRIGLWERGSGENDYRHDRLIPVRILPSSKINYSIQSSDNYFLRRMAHYFASLTPCVFGISMKMVRDNGYHERLPSRKFLDLNVFRNICPLKNDSGDDSCVISPVLYEDSHTEPVVLLLPEGGSHSFCRTFTDVEFTDENYFKLFQTFFSAYFFESYEESCIADVVESSSRGERNSGHICRYYRINRMGGLFLRVTKYKSNYSDPLCDVLWTLALVEGGVDDFLPEYRQPENTHVEYPMTGINYSVPKSNVMARRFTPPSPV